MKGFNVCIAYTVQFIKTNTSGVYMWESVPPVWILVLQSAI